MFAFIGYFIYDMISVYKEYLLYLVGDMNLVGVNIDGGKIWKDSSGEILLKLKTISIHRYSLYISHEIWVSFSMFFDLRYLETKVILREILGDHLKLVITNITYSSKF